MIDAQTIFLRTLAKLSDIDYITVGLEFDYATAASVVDVKVNGTSVGFSVTSLTSLMYALPPGVPVDEVSSVIYEKKLLNSSGESYYKDEDRPVPDAKLDFTSVDSGAVKSVFDVAGLRVSTPEAGEAVEVLVNSVSSDFFVLDSGNLVVSIPSTMGELISVEVITNTDVKTEHAFYHHQLDLSSTIGGTAKLINQFNKILMTTTGSDTFDPEIGGDMQHWVGHKQSLENKNAAIIRANLNVMRVSGYMQAIQMMSGIPPDETLAAAQVLDFSVDINDPTVGEMSLKLITLAGAKAMLALQIEKASSLVSQATEQVAQITGVGTSAPSSSY